MLAITTQFPNFTTPIPTALFKKLQIIDISWNQDECPTFAMVNDMEDFLATGEIGENDFWFSVPQPMHWWLNNEPYVYVMNNEHITIGVYKQWETFIDWLKTKENI